MAVKSLEQLQDEQMMLRPGGVKSLLQLQAEQRGEIASGVRDPVLGFIPVDRRDAGLPGLPAAQRQLRDAILRKYYPGRNADEIFGPGDPLSDQIWGRIVDKKTVQGPQEQDKAQADAALETLYTVDLGFSPEMAIQHKDLITAELAGMRTDSDGALSKISDFYHNGQIQVQLADLGLEVILGRDTPATWQEIERLRKAMRPDFPSELDTWWGDMIAAAAAQVPMMGETVEAAPLGAGAGGLAGLAAGLTISASPTIGEEGLLPSLVWAGIKGGAGLAGAWRVGQLEAGGSLFDLLDAGVDPAVAKAACFGIGAINGALELGQIRTLLATLPGGKGILKKATGAVARRLVKQGTLRGLAVQHAARFGGYLGAETLQELAQESVSVTAEELAKYITEELGGKVDYATLQEIQDRMKEVGVKSLQSFTVIGIPGSALSAGVDAASLYAASRNPVAGLLPDGRATQIQVRVPAPAKQQTAEGASAEETARALRKGTDDGLTDDVNPNEFETGGPAAGTRPAQPETGKLPGGRQAGGTILFDPDEWLQLVRRGRELIAAGTVDFAAWSERIVAEAGESIRPALTPLYESVARGEANKNPWEQTRQEYVDQAALRVSGQSVGKTKNLARTAHPFVVKQAVEDGKPVPREVLEEYKGRSWADAALAKLGPEGQPRAQGTGTAVTPSSSTQQVPALPEAPAASERGTGKLPGGRQAGGTILFNPDEWRRLVAEGRRLFDEGADQFGAWSEAMVAAAGEEIRPALRQLWQLAVNPAVEPKQEKTWERVNPQEAAASSLAEIQQSLDHLTYEALKTKAKEIGVAIRGKKAQLAALIAEAIKAKAGPEVRRMAQRTVRAGSGPQKGQKIKKQVRVVTTRIADSKALRDTEKQIREHPVYQSISESAGYIEKGGDVESRAGRIDPDKVYYVEPKYKGEVDSYVGKRGVKGFNGRLAAHLTFDPEKGQAWDQAAQEQGLELDFSGFMESLVDSLASVEKGPGGINETALKRAIDSGDPSILMLAEKRRLLRAGVGAYDINKALEKLGAGLRVDPSDYEDLLIGGGVLLDPDDPHPGSLSKFEFLDRLGRELADKDSEWIQRWSLPGQSETPFAWWQRLKAEWEAIRTLQVTADLSLGDLQSEGADLSADQEAQINAIDAERVADEIVEREKQTMFGRLLDGVFEEAAVLRDLRTALKRAYRAGASEGIATAREAYRAQRQKLAARKQLREHVGQLLRHIKRPVGASVALEQRLAIQAIQAEIDPVFRAKRTAAERQASRKFFEDHPEHQAPAKVLALIQKKTPGEMTVAEIEQAYQAVRELRRKGKILRTRQLEEKAAGREEDVAAVVNSLTGGEGLHIEGGWTIVRPPDEKARQTWWNRYAGTLTPERFLDWLDQGKEFLGPMFRIFWERVADAEAVKQRWIRQRVAATVQILKDLNLSYANLQETALVVHGEDITVEQAVGIYNFMKNLSSRLAITFGNWVTPADQTRVQEYVEARPELKALADWIVEHYEEHYERLRQAVVDVENRDMGREESYTPVRRMELDYTPDERQILDELMQRHHLKRGYAEKGMTIMRKDIEPEFQKPIRLDAWTLLLEQIERQEHYIAFGGLAKDLHGLMADESIQNALRERGGRDIVQMLQSYVDTIGNPNIFKTYGRAERFARRLRRNTSIAFLAYRLATMLKQPVSILRTLPHAGLHLVRAGLEAATDWHAVRDRCVALDPLLEHPALERELEELKDSRAKGWGELRDRIGQAGMKGIVWMDGIGRTIGWYGVYLAEMAKHGDQAKAVKQARLVTSLTQAGARAFQLPDLYRTNQEWLLLLMQFTNELNKLWNVASYDLPRMLKNSQWERAAGTFVAVGLEASIMWAIWNRRLPDEPDDAFEIFSEQAINMVPVWGPVLVGAVQGYGGADIAAMEGAGQAAGGVVRLGREIAEGTLSDGDILDAAHRVLRGLAPLAGVPYSGPRDIVRAVTRQDLGYLLGGPAPKRSGSGRRGRSRGRRRGRRR